LFEASFLKDEGHIRKEWLATGEGRAPYDVYIATTVGEQPVYASVGCLKHKQGAVDGTKVEAYG